MTLDLRRLDDNASVALQIAPEDLAAIKAAGFATVINNRPDGEEPGQPHGDAIRDAAEAAGLAYHHIPVGVDGITPHEMNTTRAVLNHGPALAFCRSGTRSCNLWAIARAAEGDEPAALVAKAAAAGYDLRGLAPTLERLSGWTLRRA